VYIPCLSVSVSNSEESDSFDEGVGEEVGFGVVFVVTSTRNGGSPTWHLHLVSERVSSGVGVNGNEAQ